MFQNQPFIDSVRNKFYWIIDKIQRKKAVLESLFNKAAVPRTCKFIKEDSAQVLPCEIGKLSEFTNFQNNILKNICECLLLNFI